MRGKNGIYGGTDCDTQSGRGLAEIIDENARYEGEIVSQLRRAVLRHDWVAITHLTERLQREGWAQFRIDSLINRATWGAV